MKISIVIPVYNVEKYIEKCILSIVKQSFIDYEIIIVDDGSKDRSGAICDMLEKQYEQIKVLHIENNGVSNARNIAIEQAKGEYIWFVDSDDFVKEDALELLFDIIKRKGDFDLLIFDAVVVDECGKKVDKISSDFPTDEPFDFEKKRQFVKSNTSLWNRLYRRSIIEENKLRFETNVSIAEDLLFNFEYLLFCNEIYYEKLPLYFYVQRKNSAMSGAGKHRDVEKAFESLIKYYKEKDSYVKYKNELEYLVIYHYYIVTSIRMLRCGINKKECNKIKEWMDEQKIKISLKNPYVSSMPIKHIALMLLLRLRCYGVISKLFAKF